MNTIFASPTTNDQPLHAAHGSNNQNNNYNLSDDSGNEENSIRVKLFFYSESKALRNKVFPEEWYHVVEQEYGADDTNKDVFQPWLEVSVAKKKGDISGRKTVGEKIPFLPASTELCPTFFRRIARVAVKSVTIICRSE